MGKFETIKLNPIKTENNIAGFDEIMFYCAKSKFPYC
jgi:hypothetical protein